jgi:hypothetical protein
LSFEGKRASIPDAAIRVDVADRAPQHVGGQGNRPFARDQPDVHAQARAERTVRLDLGPGFAQIHHLDVTSWPQRGLQQAKRRTWIPPLKTTVGHLVIH